MSCVSASGGIIRLMTSEVKSQRQSRTNKNCEIDFISYPLSSCQMSFIVVYFYTLVQRFVYIKKNRTINSNILFVAAQESRDLGDGKL